MLLESTILHLKWRFFAISEIQKNKNTRHGLHGPGKGKKCHLILEKPLKLDQKK